ncbi:MAG: hypothetical protein MSC45_06670 [Mobiluncus sp.]|uniref:hypothetical protein n=1 Tax=Mobiluncus sp. TaxID=47293 RepID=UPI00258FAA1A|nr:hypothetical protein [Mobiluncus sp.]MCI6584736.1 hypothetical protein [Mobiluncus sp.]
MTKNNPHPIDWTRLDALHQEQEQARDDMKRASLALKHAGDLRRAEIDRLHKLGIPYQEIASHLGITRQALYNSIYRAKQREK